MATRHPRGSGQDYASRWFVRLRRWLLGPPLSQAVQLHHRLPIWLALPVFASDPFSSVAYATEEILHVLASSQAPPGSPPLTQYLIPISLAIGLLMLVVVTSYVRAVQVYPHSGGSYTVARTNLGWRAGLVAASALTIDYILTVAVSASAGIAALTSYFQDLQPYRVSLTVVLILFVTIVNLRGTKESGMFFALPCYAFIVMMYVLIGSSLYHYATGGIVPIPPHPEYPHAAHGGLLWFILARAFSNGCAALTGTEAISNGVSAFQPPEGRNAARTLIIMIGIAVTMFIGISVAAALYQAVPSPAETVVSQLARANFEGTSLAFLFPLVIASTMGILMIATNTAFADLPRLLAMVARDGFAPRTLAEQGDRLVYNRGILALAVIASGLVVMFQASVNALIPLYAVGVFICFTLSQWGIAVKLASEKRRDWTAFIVSSLGAVATGTVALVIAGSKFMDGAWLVAVLIPLLYGLGILVRRHYLWFREQMQLLPGHKNPLERSAEPITIVVLVGPNVTRGTLEGVEFARSIAEGKPNAVIKALHVELDPAQTPRLEREWQELVMRHLKGKIRLEVRPSPYRWLIQPILDYLDELDRQRYGDQLIVVVPEFETGNWFSRMLHNATSWRLRQVLLGRPHITIVTTRYFLAEGRAAQLQPR